jgi:arsenate reductase
MTVTIFHNPGCSNSRGALALLEAAGTPLHVVEYLKTPLDRAQLAELAAALKATAGAAWPGLVEGMLRAKESLFAELNLAGASDDTLLDAVAAHPVLLNRPIVVTAKGAKLCRPPELVHGIL